MGECSKFNWVQIIKLIIEEIDKFFKQTSEFLRWRRNKISNFHKIFSDFSGTCGIHLAEHIVMKIEQHLI